MVKNLKALACARLHAEQRKARAAARVDARGAAQGEIRDAARVDARGAAQGEIRDAARADCTHLLDLPSDVSTDKED